MKALAAWVWRAWPLLFLMLAIGLHSLVLLLTDLDSSKVNSFVSLVLQLCGGGLVLYSIDSNIGLLRKKSLLSEVIGYFRDFPLLKRSYVLQAQGASHVVIGSRARLSFTRNPASTEEKLAYLQEQIDAFRKEHGEDITEIREILEKKTKALGDRLESLTKTTTEIESKIDQVAVGDVRIQILGVMFIVYGAIAGYVA